MLNTEIEARRTVAIARDVAVLTEIYAEEAENAEI